MANISIPVKRKIAIKRKKLDKITSLPLLSDELSYKDDDSDNDTIVYTMEMIDSKLIIEGKSNIKVKKERKIWNLKYSIEDCHKLAAEYDCKCLSTEYKGASNLLEWQCSKGHRWYRTFANSRVIKTWCKACGMMPKDEYKSNNTQKSRGRKKFDVNSITEDLFQQHGIFLVSTDQINIGSEHKVKWGCNKCDKVWYDSYYNIYRRVNKCLFCKHK